MKRISLIAAAACFILPAKLYAQDVLWAKAGSNITVAENANVYIKGGMVLDNQTTLTNNGRILLAKTGSASADLRDNTVKAYNYGSGRFIFSGKGPQKIMTINQIGTIEVDNQGLDLLSNISANNWSLKSGVVNTGANYAIASSSSTDAISGEDNNDRFSRSWINGNLRHYISPATVNQYSFPIGNATRVKLCQLDNLSADPLTGVKYVDVSFAAPGSIDGKPDMKENGMVYQSVNPSGMWKLVPDADPVSGTFDLKLSLADFSGLNDNRFGVLNHPANNSNWIIPQGSLLPPEGSDGRTLLSGFARRNRLSGFNQYAIGIMAPVAADNAAYFKVYPDPVTENIFFIQVRNYQLKGFKLFAADGKQVDASGVFLKDDQLKVSLPASFAKGTYTVQLNTDKGFRTTKIVVL